MDRGSGSPSRTRRWFVALTALALCAAVMTLVAKPSEALSTATVRVTIEEIRQEGCTDNFSGSDFYAFVTIANHTQRFGPVEGEDVLTPSDWQLERLVDVNTSPTTVVIDVWEFDGFLNFGDDHCDINPGPGLALTMELDLVPCSISGDISSACGVPITSVGNGGGDGNARIRFRVEVDEPPSGPGLAVRCMHSPLWPQPGGTVTITVESLDGEVEVDDGIDHSKVADQVEIWIDDRVSPDFTGTNRSQATFARSSVPSGDFVYGCRVRDDGASVFTGWRRVRVGPPAEGVAVPLLYTGDRKSRIDIVFVGDEGSYAGPTDANLLSDIADVVRDAYFGQAYFLENQDKFNFWLADKLGDSHQPDPDDSTKQNCVLETPEGFEESYSWRNAGAILHRDPQRDCAANRVFSTEPTSLAVALHETGHQPFGMADEYCCDGGYFENPPNPNLWSSLAECQTDAPALGRVAGDCRSFTDINSNEWSLSDPGSSDLMVDNGPPRAGDLRRMEWFFGECLADRC
jgi:hypothetical protein